MNFRRSPFKFSATDTNFDRPDITRRHRLNFIDDSMLINPGCDSFNFDDSMSDSAPSPRLQHRMPSLFQDGIGKNDFDRPGDKPPKVRIIPIEIENDKNDTTCNKQRQRTSSGGPSSAPVDPPININLRRRSNSGSSGGRSEPKVCTIPIQVESKESTREKPAKSSIPVQKTYSDSAATTKRNGPCISKSATCRSVPTTVKNEPRNESDSNCKASICQIDKIMNNFETFKEAVENFNGKQGDKTYRYIDEMLTRCMLQLDDIETFGNDEVRQARKAAVRQVQRAIDILDSKIQSGSQSSGSVPTQGKELEQNDQTTDTVVAEDVDMADESKTGTGGSASANESRIQNVTNETGPMSADALVHPSNSESEKLNLVEETPMEVESSEPLGKPGNMDKTDIKASEESITDHSRKTEDVQTKLKITEIPTSSISKNTGTEHCNVEVTEMEDEGPKGHLSESKPKAGDLEITEMTSSDLSNMKQNTVQEQCSSPQVETPGEEYQTAL